MTTLARKLRLADYFALAFGTMVGAGWLVLMGDWLGRGGPLGAILGFALGGVLLLPVGYVDGQWVQRLRDAAGEAAYTAEVFPPVVSYFSGWMLLLAYCIVCPWEAVAVGKLAAYIFPSLNSLELYRVAGQPVFLPRLVLGIGLTIFLAVLNYRGIRWSASFQNWTTGIVLLLFVLLDRKSTRLNSSHLVISYAVFCLKKKIQTNARPCRGPSATRCTHAGTASGRKSSVHAPSRAALGQISPAGALSTRMGD